MQQKLFITENKIKNKYFIKLGAVYICTEDRFPSNRIQQMMANLRFKYQCDRTDMNELYHTDYGDNILISHIATVVIYCILIKMFLNLLCF